MIGIIATLTAKPGSEAEFEAALGDFVKVVNAEEPGVMAYRCFRIDTAGVYKMLEIYADKAALSHHEKTPHMAALIGKIGGMLGAAPVLETMDAI
jgi:quinol monooxygenase YgiN